MTDKEKLEAIKAEIERLKNAAEDYIAQGGVDCICARGNIEMADDIIKYINSLPEEPVSEELWEAAQIYYEELQKEKFEGSDVIDAFKAGVQWKKEQFEKNRLKHCDSITNEQAELEQGFIDQHLDKYQRMPTFLDAVEYGMRLQKEQMMKESIDGEIQFGTVKVQKEDIKEAVKSLRKGEKVKIIVIKED